MTEALAVVGGYLLGSLPFGYWLPGLRGEDIRASGSENVGATNVFHRVYGRRLGTAVVLLDVGKGFAAALLGIWAGGALVGVLAGAAAMLRARAAGLPPLPEGREDGGHGRRSNVRARPARGVLRRRVALAFLFTRYASVASIVTALALVLFVWVFGHAWPVLVFAVVGAAAIVFVHRHNLRRLSAGTEHRFELRRPRRALGTVPERGLSPAFPAS